MWAILPLKLFDGAKQRLSGFLTSSQRRLLFAAMVEDVLSELARVKSLEGVLVISPDPAARGLARKYGAEFLAEPSDNLRGLNGAVDCAIRHLLAHDAAGVMVLHGDVPLIRSDEIERLVQIHQHRPTSPRVTVVADLAKQGTNALLCSPPNVIPFRYGLGSYEKHIEETRKGNVSVETVESNSIALDIDSSHDIHSLVGIMRSDLNYQRRRTCLVLQDIGLLGPLRTRPCESSFSTESTNEGCFG